MLYRSLLLPGMLLLLAACTTSHIPLEIRQPPEPDPVVKEVRDDIERYQGQRVRWGGRIASVDNKENETWIEVVATDLDSSGQPRLYDSSYGRFLVRIDSFLDPQIYAPERELTVYGEVESRLVRPIGDHPYTYPLVRARTYYLWPEYVDVYAGRRHYHPYFHYYPYPYSLHFRYGYYYPYRHPYFW